MKKLSDALKRVGAYLNANKRTAGGILTSIGVTFTSIASLVVGYATDFTNLIADKYESMKWLDALTVKGFNFAPLILALIGIGFVIWNTFAAVSRGLETPEVYAAKEAEEAERKRVEEEKAEAERLLIEAEAANEKAKQEALAELEAEREAALKAEEERKEAQKRALLEAQAKAAEEEHRRLVEKYKAELLAERVRAEQDKKN